MNVPSKTRFLFLGCALLLAFSVSDCGNRAPAVTVSAPTAASAAAAPVPAAPTLTPRTSRLAVAAPLNGKSAIYSMLADGTQVTNLTDGTANDDFPAWSPDGSKIAFVSDRDGPREIYVMSAEGSTPMRVSANQMDERGLLWSPDSKRIAFFNRREGQKVDLYAIDSDGSGQVQLGADLNGPGFFTWSPDSQWLAFLAVVNEKWDVFAARADGSGLRNLSNSPGQDRGILFTRDSHHLLFGSDRRGSEEIYRIVLDGTDPPDELWRDQCPRGLVAGWGTHADCLDA